MPTGSNPYSWSLKNWTRAARKGWCTTFFRGMSPQGMIAVGFKQPTSLGAGHDFLWRADRHAPAKGEVVIFSRSHNEDVLAVRVDKLAFKSVWSRRYEPINDFEVMGTPFHRQFFQLFSADQPQSAMCLKIVPGNPEPAKVEG
jgi:polyphosphate kinase 2 (PPK2 family)